MKFYTYDDDENKRVPFKEDIDYPYLFEVAEKLGGEVLPEVLGLGREAYDIQILLEGTSGDHDQKLLYFRCLDGWDEGGWACGLKTSYTVTHQSFSVRRVETMQEAYSLLAQRVEESAREAQGLVERLQQLGGRMREAT